MNVRMTTNGSEMGTTFAKHFMDGLKDYFETREELKARLRALGVKAAHPNDGWVGRGEHGIPQSIVLNNPLFRNATIKQGDIIALYESRAGGTVYHLWRVTGHKDNRFAQAINERADEGRRYFLEPAEAETAPESVAQLFDITISRSTADDILHLVAVCHHLMQSEKFSYEYLPLLNRVVSGMEKVILADRMPEGSPE